jgi:hypothetical protein
MAIHSQNYSSMEEQTRVQFVREAHNRRMFNMWMAVALCMFLAMVVCVVPETRESCKRCMSDTECVQQLKQQRQKQQHRPDALGGPRWLPINGLPL